MRGVAMLRGARRRLEKTLRVRGLGGTLSFAVTKLVEYVRSLGWRRRVKRTDTAFDDQHGVDTGGLIPLSDLDIENENWVYGLCYAASPPELFDEILGRLRIRHEDFVFVDFGSGKGRALLLASAFPFKRITGIEFSARLHAVAQRNIAAWLGGGDRRCKTIESLCMDAATYPIPTEPTVFYLYRPFEDRVLATVLASIQQSLAAHPREVFVLYMNPLPDSVLGSQDWLTEIERDTIKQYVVYRSR